MLAIVGLVVLVTASMLGAIISSTITIDGDLNDWAGVRGDAGNASQDTQLSDPDPDYPGQPDRDVYLVNATWDDEYLYLAYRRTSGGTKAITFAAYIDRDGDGLLQNTDVVTWWSVGQSDSSRFADAHAPSPTAGIYRYNQAINGQGGPLLYPAGDPMGYDGETPDGWADVQSGQILPVEPMDGWMALNGVEFEGRVAWADLQLAPGSPIAIHFINANGSSFGQKWVPSNTRKYIGNPPQYLEENRGQVEDNVDDIWWLRLNGVTVTPNHEGGGEPGDTVPYSHIVRNTGNTTQTIDLSAVSDQGWTTTITDTSGVPTSSIVLGPGDSMTIRARVTIDGSAAPGTRDITTVRAQYRSDPTVSDTAIDNTFVGRVLVTSNQSGSMAPGQVITYRFNVQNNTSLDSTYTLSALSSLGWPYTILNSSGSPISSIGIASGGTASVLVSITVPPTATMGQVDTTRLTASLLSDPSVRDSAVAVTSVRAGVTIDPDLMGYGGANTSIDYLHTVTNSWPTTRTFTLSRTTSQGWPVSFFAGDGITAITSVTVGPNGATSQVIARVQIPGGTGSGVIDTTVVTVTSGSYSDSATDKTTVRRLMLYEDSGYTSPSDTYHLTDPVYSVASGLKARDKVVFVWKDPAGTIIRTSPARTVDTAGLAFDDYTTTTTSTVGTWTVELQTDKGVLLETTQFVLRHKARITGLSATDAPGVGEEVAIDSSVENLVSREVTDSVLTYVIWWDDNGDGTFNTGDTWIDSSGAPHTWNGVSQVETHKTLDVDVAGNGTWDESSPWTVNNRLFPHQGNYNVTLTWRDSRGILIDQRTTSFYSIPVLGWPVFALALLGGGLLLARTRLRLERGEVR